MKVTKQQLRQLIITKLVKAGMLEEHAIDVSEVLVFADSRGYQSHGAIRVEYYAERIARGGINCNPQFQFQQTGPCTATFDGDNGAGQVAAKKAMEHAIEMAKNNGVAVVGVQKISHSGALAYFVQQAAQADLIGISVCQADPMVVPYGGTKPYYGTNPIAFATRAASGRILTFDMATAVKAWGKILEARYLNKPIPDDWAVDREGKPTTDPFKVNGLMPTAGPKGYGLAMMVDILSGVLLGLPFGGHVSPLYGDLSTPRNLGQLHIVIHPAYFTNIDTFKDNIERIMLDLNAMEPAEGFSEVMYPGQGGDRRAQNSELHGVEIADDVYHYLISDQVHNNRYHHYDPFAQ